MAKTAGSRLKAVSAGLTDVGRKRNHNEDSYLVDEELQLYVVADGMGGHAGGGTASRIAVETIDREMRAAKAHSENPFASTADLQDSPLPEFLRGAVEKACLEIYRAESSRRAPNTPGCRPHGRTGRAHGVRKVR